MKVSVIIPAHDAASTLRETLASLLKQTHHDWEGVIVDDGSSDDTAQVARRWARRYPRLGVISQARAGEAGARNTGVREANSRWLLFLDADDWLLPTHLERMTARLEADPSLDAVHCGSARVALDGTLVPETFQPPEGDLFPVLARRAAFPVHACLVRRTIVEEVGAFDPLLCTSPDWDLWQRIARTGARFGAVREVLAMYRMRPGSASMNAVQLARDGLTVLRRGHGPDPRVPNPTPLHAGGMPPDGFAAQACYLITWCAGLSVGQGGDAPALLEELAPGPVPDLSADGIAQTLFDAVPVSSCMPPDSWLRLWPDVEQNITVFLEALEQHSRTAGLARSTRAQLERRILGQLKQRPLTIGSTHAVRLEVTQPIADITVGPAVHRLLCQVLLEGAELGELQLPVCDAVVAADVLRDAIAARHAWAILRAYLERAVYPEFQLRGETHGTAIYRGSLRIADDLPVQEEALRKMLHERVGWTVLLQEAWSRADWPNNSFYDPGLPEEPVGRVHPHGDRVQLEIGEPLPDIVAPGRRLEVLVSLGGVPLVLLPFDDPLIRAQQVRAAVTQRCGFELCRALVREALVGISLSDPRTIPQRLAAAASVRAGTSPTKDALLLGRHPGELAHTGGWRRTTLPAAAAGQLLRLAEQSGQPTVGAAPAGNARALVSYLPEIFPAPGTVALAASSAVTTRLPILLYHRVAPASSDDADPRRIDPEAFAAQLAALRERGFRSTTIEEWTRAVSTRTPLHGRRIAISFDVGYADVWKHAWPLLQWYGFSATVFIVTDAVGSVAGEWGAPRDTHLLNWEEVRLLRDQGAEIGSNSATHRPLVAATPEQIVHEAVHSRIELQERLGAPVRAFAYPYGAEDEVVQHLVGACGYWCAVSRRSAGSTFSDTLLSLPRIEVRAIGGMDSFLGTLHG